MRVTLITVNDTIRIYEDLNELSSFLRNWNLKLIELKTLSQEYMIFPGNKKNMYGI
jgi:hypothetical protein